MSTLYLGHSVQFFDDNGDPLSGGVAKFYEPGTATPKDVYSDSGLGTPLGSEVTLDSAGRATIFLNGDYKARLEDSDGTLVDETDNINPPLETETSGGNLVANGSFETAGNASTDADGWTLTAQSDGTVERITTDNYDGEAALKFTSDGSGGGQADTNAFFAVSPGRTYEISFALKCSVADIRNIVQVRYFDSSQSFLSSTSVYDEDTDNPTSWTLKSFTDTPPANARFAKLRILGADQSDATAGEAKFDDIRGVSTDPRFTSIEGDISASVSPNLAVTYYDGVTSDVTGSAGVGDNVTDIAFSSDGMKMFTSAETQAQIMQFNLPSAFDVGSIAGASEDERFGVGSEETAPQGVEFNGDGTKMYVVGTGSGDVLQYSLSTGFDVSTASYDSVSLDVSSEDTSPKGIFFNNDGTKLFLAGGSGNSVYQYTLLSAYDLSSASYASKAISVSNEDTDIESVAFSVDGMKMFIAGDANNKIYQYSLIEAFDVGSSNVAFSGRSFDISGSEYSGSPVGVRFNNAMTKMFVANNTSSATVNPIYQHSCGMIEPQSNN